MSEAVHVPLTLANGGPAAIVENQGDHVVVRSSVPSPPGSTLALSQQGLSVQVKVRGCKRMAEGDLPFRIEGRLVSLTRTAREQLFGVKPNGA
ncbi:MAG TPA: hypothetical protein VK745_06610 [Polyangiaceae bacterium]|jgi:hypothetical protein|nr:hypothetical protein [Polyangiaceae bacterium]